MSQPCTLMDIFKLLDKSNCKKCNKPTCLAFAAAVFQGQRQLDQCPHLDRETIERFANTAQTGRVSDQEVEATLAQLKSKIADIDLAAVAQGTGGTFKNDKLTIKLLGKDVSVDAKGNFSSDIHLHQGVVIPVLDYILEGRGVSVSGQWVPFRELRGGKTWFRLFGQRCERPLKKVADAYTDLFEDMIHIFNGKPVERHFDADISLVLHPLPKVPILICYWKPEDGLESDLNLFFDATAEDNLKIESLFALGTGLTRMFELLALRHGAPNPNIA